MSELPAILLSAGLALCAENNISPCNYDGLWHWAGSAVSNKIVGISGCGFGEPNGHRCAGLMCRDADPVVVATFQTYQGDWGWTFVCVSRGVPIS